MSRWILAMLVATLWPATLSARRVHMLKVTVLSTMLSDDQIGEWGYAALVEVDGRRILFDTARGPIPCWSTPAR